VTSRDWLPLKRFRRARGGDGEKESESIMKEKSRDMDTSNELKGKTAFIAGGSTGIGFAMAQAFGHLGMNIVLADEEAMHLKAAVENLRAKNVPIEGLLMDVSNSASLRTAAEKAKSFFGRVHVVCNYAGIKTRPSQFFMQKP
jgi:NAD(P)-dependent dehydrogenase (short-subunit alcohol dehydrogenase family)